MDEKYLFMLDKGGLLICQNIGIMKMIMIGMMIMIMRAMDMFIGMASNTRKKT